MRRVGLIGLGLVGSALAERLRAAGSELLGYDVLDERRQEFAQAGGQPRSTAEVVFAGCDVVLLSLPDSQVVAAVLQAVEPKLRAAQLVIDTSTGDPEQTAALGALLARRGVEYLDATIVGSSAQVRSGEVIVMAGGTDAAFHTASQVLACFARQVFHVGSWGAGSRMKLVVNLVLGLNRAALAEGLTLAKALELDPALALSVLQAGAAYSAIMDTKGPKMLAGDFTPQARLSQHLKDVRLILAAAERTGRELPLSTVHRQLLERAEAAGYGDADNSAILRAFDR